MHRSSAARWFPIAVNAVVMALCLFGARGSVAWWNGWCLIALSLLTSLASSAAVWAKTGLPKERRKLQHADPRDKLLIALTVVLLPIATWVAAGIEARIHPDRIIPFWIPTAGIACALVGGAQLIWALRTNEYFSSIVRIQHDRGQMVVTTGPYRLVRHPGYAGMALFMIGTPLILASRIALIPAALSVGFSVVRTLFEDRTLMEGLAGYREYAAAVRYRWVPLVW